MAEYVDRGSPLSGLDKTTRDSRQAKNKARAIENFRLPDSRLKRRKGYTELYLDRVHGNQLTKQTAATIESIREDQYSIHKTSFYKTPLSYGLLRWHSEFQPRTDKDWTVEFLLTIGDKESLVSNAFDRKTEDKSPGSHPSLSARHNPGVFVYDQSVIANYLTFSTHADLNGQNAATRFAVVPPVTSTTNLYSNWALSALSVSYTETQIKVTSTLIDNANSATAYQGCYYPYAILLTSAIASYVAGTTYHIAVVFDADGGGATGTLSLFVNGSLASSYTIPRAELKFAGEYETVNGLTTNIQRDIVILNECSARGSYSSTCKITKYSHGYQTFFHDNRIDSTTDSRPIPWVCSPPRGTAMSELRIWQSASGGGGARTSTQLGDNRLIPLAGNETGLVGYWKLSDGGGICYNSKSNSTRTITIHHTYPQYTRDDNLLCDFGLSFADGQHLIVSTGETDFRDDSSLHASLVAIFGPNYTNTHSTAVELKVETDNDFTVQVQIKTPYTYQQEINKRTGAISLNCTRTGVATGVGFANFYDVTKVSGNDEARDSMLDSGGSAIAYHLLDGTTTQNVLRTIIGSSGSAPSDVQYLRAYDSTIFSVEGVRNDDDSSASAISSYYDNYRVPLARGLITPDGRVAFEFFQGTEVPATDLPPLYHRLVSATQLTADTIYTITFVKRTLFWNDTSAGRERKRGYSLEIYLNGSTTADAQLIIDASNADSRMLSSTVNHKTRYDVIIGASFVNDNFDKSISGLFGHSAPWLTQQRFMSPYQDQPGFFTLGMFRMWAKSIAPQDIARYYNTRIAQIDFSANLMINLEIDGITGHIIKSRGPIPVEMVAGFKSWGEAETYKDSDYNSQDIKTSQYPGAWASHDCLGYSGQPDSFDNKYTEGTCNLLALYNSVLTGNFGLLSVFEDSLYYDNQISGTRSKLTISLSGLLNEFAPGEQLHATQIADRTIITGAGAHPKVFNGRHVTPIGFTNWFGGIPLVRSTATAGSLISDKWYGVAIVYTAEAIAIQHISPRVVTKLSTTGTAFDVINIPPHPDPRVTGFRVYRTQMQESRDLAYAAPLYATYEGMSPNKFMTLIAVVSSDDDLSTVILDENITTTPHCAYSASINDRLYLTGDSLIPDAVYYSVAGNPEKFDTAAQVITLEEGRGDAIIGAVALFGSLFVFKPNSTWRIDETGATQEGDVLHDRLKIADIGPAVPRAYTIITMPNEGRTVIFVFSKHGPYLFDGHNYIYIGDPVEGDLDDPYSGIDTSSIHLLHDIQNKEIVCFYKKKTAGVTSTRYDEAIVFNYRTGSWHSIVPITATYALSAITIGSDAASGIPAGGGDATVSATYSYRPLFGSDNGKIYTLNGGSHDGVPTLQSDNLGTVSSYAAPTITLSSLTLTDKNCRGLWATVVRTSGSTIAYFSLPIQDNTTSTIRLDTSYAAVGFTPASGDLVYVGQPPALIEFPWDDFDQPRYDKQVVNLITWHDGAFYYRTARDWSSSYELWKALTDNDGKRKETKIVVGHAEVFKLQMLSLDLASRLDQFGYDITRMIGGVKPQ